jgi:hypothetical protein
MQIAVRQRREVTLTLAYPGSLSVAGGATMAGALAFAVWRWRQQRFGRQLERWRRQGGD